MLHLVPDAGSEHNVKHPILAQLLEPIYERARSRAAEGVGVKILLRRGSSGRQLSNGIRVTELRDILDGFCGENRASQPVCFLCRVVPVLRRGIFAKASSPTVESS